MNAHPRIPIKTERGLAELAPGQRRLSQRHRTVLFCVDGKRNESQVRQMSVQAGAPPECFDELLAQGLIEFVSRPVDIALPIAEPLPEQKVVFTGAASSQPAQAIVPKPAVKTFVPAQAAPVPALPTASQRVSQVQTDAKPLETFHVIADPDSTGFDSLIGESTHSPLSTINAALTDRPLPLDLSAPVVRATVVDGALEDARQILVHLVKTESPVAGEPTLMHLHRVQTKAEMLALLPEVEWRISKPHRALTVAHTMRLVRQLLGNEGLDVDAMEEDE